MYSRQKLFDFHDKPGRLLARLLANSPDQIWAGQMCYSDSCQTSDLGDKLKIFAQFYEYLYTSASPSHLVLCGFLDHLNIPQLSEEHRLMMEAFIMVVEVETAIDGLKNNKSPSLNFIRNLRMFSS